MPSLVFALIFGIAAVALELILFSVLDPLRVLHLEPIGRVITLAVIGAPIVEEGVRWAPARWLGPYRADAERATRIGL